MNERQPKVSFVVPCYNVRRYLRECLDSIVMTAPDPYEVVIVDDGSTEEIRDIVDEFGPRVRYIRQANQGPGAARNTGIRATTGRYIRFVDADDILLSTEAMNAQITMLEEHPKVGLVYGQAMNVDSDRRSLGIRRPWFAHGNYVRDGAAEVESLLSSGFSYIPTSSTIARRSVVLQTNLFRTDLFTGQDYEFWIRLAGLCDVGYVDTPVVAYRVHNEGVTARKTDAQRQARFSVIDEFFANSDNAKRYAHIRPHAELQRSRLNAMRAYRDGEMRLVRYYARHLLVQSIRLRSVRQTTTSSWLLMRASLPGPLRQQVQRIVRHRRLSTAANTRIGTHR